MTDTESGDNPILKEDLLCATGDMVLTGICGLNLLDASKYLQCDNQTLSFTNCPLQSKGASCCDPLI